MSFHIVHLLLHLTDLNSLLQVADSALTGSDRPTPPIFSNMKDAS